jgi:Domain of unknown function (DUF4410)
VNFHRQRATVIARLSRPFFSLLLFVSCAPLIAQAQMPGHPQPGGAPASPPSGADEAQESAATPPAPEKPKLVYVTDFEVDGTAPQDGAATPPSNNSASESPRIVKVMSENLLKDFAKAGYIAKTWRAGDPKPEDGFLIVGVFTQVDSENRLHRALLAPNSNSTPIELYVAVQDLTRFTQHLYNGESGGDGRKPGQVIEINPKADASKFAVEPGASDKSLKQTAQQIANELNKRIAAEVKYEPLNRYAKP